MIVCMPFTMFPHRSSNRLQVEGRMLIISSFAALVGCCFTLDFDISFSFSRPIWDLYVRTNAHVTCIYVYGDTSMSQISL